MNCIKEGQIYQDENNNKFLVYKVDKVGIATNEVILKSLQYTESYIVGEYIPTTAHYLSKWNLSLCDNLKFTELDNYKLEIEILESDIKFYQKNSFYNV